MSTSEQNRDSSENERRSPVNFVEIDDRHAGQRVDNFLLNFFKTVPRSHVYRVIRKGQVRVNKKRVKATYRLCLADVVRVPPMTQTAGINNERKVPKPLLEQLSCSSLYEDEKVWVINKPPGISVHAGTGSEFGVIDALRQLRPELRFLELVHRLDRETSGCLVLAKQREVLMLLHQQIREGAIEKNYKALLVGRLQLDFMKIDQALLSNQLQGGERMVVVSDEGKAAETHVWLLERYEYSSLVSVRLLTGRKHQIRAHAAFIGYPVVGDRKYGDKEFNQQVRQLGVKRLMLHAETIRFTLDKVYDISAPLPDDMQHCLVALAK